MPGCENDQPTPGFLWHMLHSPARWFAGRAWHDSQFVAAGCVNAKLLPGPAVWHVVQSLLVVCGGLRLLGGVWQSPQVLICGWVNFQSTPGPLRWQTVQSAFQVCGGLRLLGGVWHVAQSVRWGCVKTNLRPAEWQIVQSAGRPWWFGPRVWQLAHPIAAISWQFEHPTVRWLGMSAFPPPGVALDVGSVA